MKTFILPLVLLLSVSLPTFAKEKMGQTKAANKAKPAVPLNKGKLDVTYKGVSPPINVTELDNAKDYAALEDKTKSLRDGPEVMKVIRGFAEKTQPTSDAIDVAVENSIDPEHKYESVFDLMEDESSDKSWAKALFKYAAGDESDDEPVYVTVNRQLRGDRPLTEETINWVNTARQGLSHLPKFESTTFRGGRMKLESIDKRYVKGKAADDDGLISSSINPNTAFRFAKPGVNGPADKEDNKKIATIFLIQGKTGRPVSSFAFQHNHEQEVLFANGTPMQVVDRSPVFPDEILGKTMIIVLKEK